MANDSGFYWRRVDSGRNVRPVELVGTTAPAAGGIAEVRLAAVPPDKRWEIDRISVSSTSTKATSCVLYVDDATPGNVLDGTRSGNFDINDTSTPLRVAGSREVLVRWTGCSAGAVGTVRLQLLELAVN